ncbi:MAG: hypothetical protein FWG15_05940 [Propionibacteriaceae bacterium]|jgi:plasmid stability protein|nr:hypothetical protein [Propionibacteriaceae bacterium]
MAAVITVRNVNERTQRALKHRAVENNRSLEAEIRSILDEVAREEKPTNADILFDALAEFGRAANEAGFVFPERVYEEQREVFS